MNNLEENLKTENLKKTALRSIPKGYQLLKDGIYGERSGESVGIYVSNFLPVVLSHTIAVDVHSGAREDAVEFTTIVMDKSGASSDLNLKKTIRLSEIDKLDFQNEISNKLYVNPMNKVASKVLSAIVRKQYAEAEEKIVYTASRLGFFEITIDGEKKRGYIAGNKCIGLGEEIVRISPKLQRYQLIPPDSIMRHPDSDAVEEYINNLLQLNKRAPVLMAYNSLAIMRKLFAEANNPIKFALYVKGEQSTGKTTISTLCCSMYNRADDVEMNIHNLTATEAKLNEVLSTEADTVVIIDDLRKSDSLAIMKQQEQRLDNLIRVVANNVGKETMRYSFNVNGAALFTGEYALRNNSTNNRIVLLEFFKEDFDSKRLRSVQTNPHYLSFFFSEFIEFITHNYEDVLDLIKYSTETYREERENESPYQERLQAHASQLTIAYKIFLNFCKYKNWDIACCHNDFEVLMQNVISYQIECLELERKEEDDYVVELFSRCYKDMQFSDYSKDPKKHGWQMKMFLDKGKGTLYIPGDTIEDYISDINAHISVYAVMGEFENLGLLYTDKCKQHTRTKKYAKRRCYAIDYEKWKEWVKIQTEKEED